VFRLVSVLVRQCRVLSVRVRRGRFIVGTFPAWPGKCRYVFGEDYLMTGLVRRIQVIVGMCPASSDLCWEISG